MQFSSRCRKKLLNRVEREVDYEQFCETEMSNPSRAKLGIKETVGVLQ